MRIGKYIAAFAGALILSCSDITDIQPTHSLTPNNAFKTMDDFELLLNGVYAGLQGSYPLAYGMLPDIMSDNLAENAESLGTYRTTSDWLFVSNDATISPLWLAPYIVINNCNVLLGSIDNFKETKSGQKNRLKSQALAVRALLHFDLLRYFGQSYDRNSTALGIPIKTAANLDKPGRNTVKEVYDQIYADLNQAKTMMGGVLDQAINTTTDRSRIDAIGVNAIFARVAYYAKDYATAATNASNVINSGMGLANRTDFPTIWNADAITNEVIWYIKYFPGDGYVGGDVYFAVNNRVSYNPSANLLSIYDAINDIRYSSYFSSTTANRPGQLIVSKYIGPTGDGLVNWKALRMGEMYLIRSESLARTNQDVAAMADLNALRAARILGYTPQTLSGSTLLTAIAVERRKELFLEGHRWFDLRISGQGINRGSDCKAPATNCSLAIGSFRFVWPIPQDEIKANPSIAGQQNTGY
ncbi:MAG TPA: RagB/SusD family nutrient uptake outer membrane protein [Cyclobacteriaceae bacterium]|nr:RagB/SusD family nutrient uptake outer membrane protein [Cyclobacteriaceae bacterium]